VDAKEPGTTAFWDESLKLDDILRLLDGARSAAKFVVFDACRNELQLPTKDTTKGLVPVAEQQGMFIAYASAPGRTASDRGMKSGPYAAALAAELGKTGLDHLNLFQNVKEAVLASTGGAQQPWESNGLGRRVYLTGVPKPAEPPRAAPSAPPQISEAERVWRWVKDTTNQPVLENFIKEFGDTPFGAMARARAEELKKQQVAVATRPVPAAKSSVSVAPTPTSPTAPPFEQPSYRNANYSIQNNIELFGDPLSKAKERIVDRCADACQERRECAGFTFDTRQQICSTLKAVHSRIFAEGFVSGDRIVSPVMGSSQVRKDEKSIPVAVFQDVELFGDVLEKSAESNPDRCARACQDRRECVGFTSSKALASCVMFRKIHSRMSGQGYISGGLPGRRN
jgi:hypothetical protein